MIVRWTQIPISRWTETPIPRWTQIPIWVLSIVDPHV